jgi:hypothetical protein
MMREKGGLKRRTVPMTKMNQAQEGRKTGVTRKWTVGEYKGPFLRSLNAGKSDSFH